MKNEKIKISTKNLNVFYGPKQALFDINLEVEEKKSYSVDWTFWMRKIYLYKMS